MSSPSPSVRRKQVSLNWQPLTLPDVGLRPDVKTPAHSLNPPFPLIHSDFYQGVGHGVACAHLAARPWCGGPQGAGRGAYILDDRRQTSVFGVLCPLICHNGGVCVKPDRCLCPPDFAGKFCQLHSSGARPPAPAMPGFTRSVYTMPLANHRDDEHGEESAAGSAPREDGYSDASGFGYCFRELRGGECASPLPGLRTQEVCCRGAGLAWGVHDCQSCSELLGKPQDVPEETPTKWASQMDRVQLALKGLMGPAKAKLGAGVASSAHPLAQRVFGRSAQLALATITRPPTSATTPDPWARNHPECPSASPVPHPPPLGHAQASVNAIPRSVARDAAFPGPVATPARATPVSGSARRACAALVSQAEGEEGGGAGGSTLSPPDQTPPYPQTWTNVAAFPRLVLPGAAKTRQAASVACAGRASELARGVRNVDECIQSPGLCGRGVCENLPGSFHCVCPAGFRGSACEEDVDECAQEPPPCGPGRCDNTAGSFHCACPAGFRSRGPGAPCQDVDECARSPPPCTYGRCENTEGSFQCVCPTGFQPSAAGSECEDVDECENHLACPGQDAGPVLLVTTCTMADVLMWTNAVRAPPAAPTATALTLKAPSAAPARQATGHHLVGPGPAQVGWAGKRLDSLGVGLGFLGKAWWGGGSWTKGLQVEFRNRPSGRGLGLGGGSGNPAALSLGTLDVNECLEGDFCFPNGECLNTDGSFACTCAPGYRPGPRGASCLDVDECRERGPALCGSQRCENSPGSYRCVRDCDPGYHAGPEGTCDDVDECQEYGPGICGAQRYVNECETLQGVCGAALCENVEGSFLCVCPNSPEEFDPMTGRCVPPRTSADDNLGVCWQEVGADLVCSRPRLDRQATYTECCCLYGEAWGMDCALCPAQDSDDFEALCNVLRPPAYGPPRPGGFGLPYEYGPDLGSPYQGLPYGPELYLPPVLPYDPYPPPPGPFARREAPYGTPPFDMPDFEDDGGPYGESEAPAPPGPGSRWRYRSRDTRGSVPEPEESPEGGSYAGAQAGPYEGLEAEECGILDGCAHGRCVRVPEGFTCDCFDGYRLDMTRMACVDINECDEAEAAAQLCVNARCVNTDGSFRCICRPGFAPSHEPHHCTPARPRA
ncbi:hypothetical protein E2I00_012107 [Balaenoptera physalus]|uniref:Latent-transforming growth factor beta-binding protein 4 n=1 Tax=Balaenoptera physalus TaxID=9770 RepID=A0A643C8D0_BALPH|nr:hypothetical protein E2I00_012107 [Balaenoptera physalus]